MTKQAMKIGIDSYSYHRYFGEVYPGQKDPGIRWNIKDFIRQTSTLPLEAVAFETCFLSPQDKEYLADHDLPPVNFMFAWGHPDGFMRISKTQALDEITEFLSLSHRLGLDTLRVVGSSITYFHEPHEPQIERTIDYLQQILPLTEKLGVKLAIENHGDFFIGELQYILEQCRSPFLGITLDTGNCLRLREDPLDAIEVFKRKIFVVHAKDIAPVPGFTPEDPLAFGCVPAGEGMTDFTSILNALGKHDYKGMILIEISRPHPDFEHVEETEIIKKGLHYLMRLREEQERKDATER